MKTKTKRGLGLAAWLVAALWLSVASGHPQFALSTVNRYGKVVFGGPGGVKLFYTLMIGDVPANAVRQQADRDSDGQLSAAEQQELGKMLASQLEPRPDNPDHPGLSLELDGKPLPIRWQAPLLTLPDPRVGPLAFACELTATLDIPAAAGSPGQAHTLRYDDRVAMPPVGDVELRIEEGPGARVEGAYQGTTPPKSEGGSLIFLNQGPPRSSLSDRSITIRFAPAAASAQPLFPQRRTPWRLGLALVALLALVAGIWGLRARRGRAGQ